MSMFGKAGAVVIAATTAMLALAGPAAAGNVPDGSDVPIGGLLSNIGSKSAASHANACSGRLQLLSKRTCVGDDRNSPAPRTAGGFGGILSNIGSTNASDHSNACGSTIAIFSDTRCIIVEHHDGRPQQAR
ncbi:hypothetical protein ABZ951_16350 [Streptomyces sp. NPDC046215]|uniref:Chaplin domain-containing protein n=1 Tax=Streptomyces stramineus TaxID=173861 RepID=A0ABP3K1H6_9ACTN